MTKDKEFLEKDFIFYITSIWNNETSENNHSDFETYIQILEDYATYEDKSSFKKEAVELIMKMHQNIPSLRVKSHLHYTAFLILEKIGYFKTDEPLWLKKHSINHQEYNANRDTGTFNIDKYEYTDYTNYYTVTVDGEGTQDFDDALSLKVYKDQFEVIVHIADTTLYIQPNSFIDQKALDRGRSLYFPTENKEMLPLDLYLDKISLVEKKKRYVLSFSFIIDSNYNLVSYNIHRGLICVDRNFTYQEVENILQQPNAEKYPYFDFLFRMAQKFQNERINQSLGIEFLFKKVDARVDKQNNTYLKIYNPADNSVFMIKEWMILTNNKTAEFCLQNSIPCLFLNQEKSNDIIDISSRIITTKKELNKIKPYMLKSFISTDNYGHFALGVPCYTQITSPIRRYLDLILQRQLLEYISTDHIMYSKEQLLEYYNHIESNKSNFYYAELEANKYYLLKYLFKKFYKKPLHGTVIKILNSNHYLVELSDTLIVSKIYSEVPLQEMDEVIIILNTIISRIQMALGKLVNKMEE